ncbi:MAG: hypothetical protein OK422_04005 [Thaumarchaeota archaeon]|nr:hypothetical protein [Nitrososphaerota archaeon]
MVYESKLKSKKRLFEELRELDADAGVRAWGTFDGRKSLIFITRHSGKYAIWIRGVRLRRGDRGSFKDFRDYASVNRFLSSTLDTPIKAYLY